MTRPAFSGQEEFRWNTSFRDQLVRLSGMALFLLVVTTLLAAALLHLAGVDAFWLAAVIGAAFTGLCVYLKSRQFENKFARRTLVLDAHGLLYRDRDFTVDLPWERVYEIGNVPELRVLQLNTKGGRRVAAGANAAQGASAGLVGGGTLAATSGASAAFRMQISQNLAAAPKDPQTGQPAFGVPLSPFDRAWRSGRIGQWVDHFRPGLPVTAGLSDGR